MILTTGSPAPRFETLALDGSPVRVEDFTGRRLLLAFFRNAGCAICNLRVHELIQHWPALQTAGIVVVAVFESPPAALHAHVARQQPPFPLIADPEARLYDLYGVEVSSEQVAATIARPDTATVIQRAADHGFPLVEEHGSNFHRIPAEFLIGPDLTILRAHYSEYLTDHLDLDDVLSGSQSALAAD